MSWRLQLHLLDSVLGRDADRRDLYGRYGRYGDQGRKARSAYAEEDTHGTSQRILDVTMVLQRILDTTILGAVSYISLHLLLGEVGGAHGDG